MKQRYNGVILHMTTLPGPYGIGTFSEEAKHAARLLAKGKVSWWQVLPFTPPSEGNSPYTSYSAFAGCSWFIDPRQIEVLTEEECESFRYEGPPFEVDYDFVRHNSERYLRLAYSRLDEATMDKVRAFAEGESWLTDYARFMAIRRSFDDLPWYEWPDEALRLHDEVAVEVFAASHRQEIEYIYYCQWEFHRQWMALKDYINELGIGIIGDIPIYVARDSSDAWANPQLYLLDEENQPTAVAGVPPDYFSEDGQLWGNPLYDWDYHREHGYSWWIDRMKQNLTLFDAVRIDHFRGFESYWAVPVEAETAKEGEWRKGPGMSLFRALEEALDEPRILAEDLGIITDDVRALREETGYPGMMVMQFALGSFESGQEMPHRTKENMVLYTGTHDNNTILGWAFEDDPFHRQQVLDYIGFPDQGDWTIGGWYCPINRAMIRQTWSLPPFLAMTTIQDLLGYGGETRMNIPGTVDGNWVFRVPMDALGRIDFEWLAYINGLFDRDHPYDAPEEAEQPPLDGEEETPAEDVRVVETAETDATVEALEADGADET